MSARDLTTEPQQLLGNQAFQIASRGLGPFRTDPLALLSTKRIYKATKQPNGCVREISPLPYHQLDSTQAGFFVSPTFHNS